MSFLKKKKKKYIYKNHDFLIYTSIFDGLHHMTFCQPVLWFKNIRLLDIKRLINLDLKVLSIK